MYIAHLQNCRRDKETFLLLLRTPPMLQIIRFSFLRLDWHTRCGHQVVMVRLICLSRKPPFHTSFLFFTSEIFVWYANQLFIPSFLLFPEIFSEKIVWYANQFFILLSSHQKKLYGMQTSFSYLLFVSEIFWDKFVRYANQQVGVDVRHPLIVTVAWTNTCHRVQPCLTLVTGFNNL